MSNKLLRDFSYLFLTLLRLMLHKVAILLTSQREYGESAIALMCDSLVKNEKCKVKSRGAGSAYLFFGGRKDIEGRRAGGFFLAEKRFTFAFLSVEEDFGKGRVLIWRVEHHSTQDIAERRTGGFFLAEKRFTFSFLSIEEDFGRGRNCIGREMGRIRQCGAYGNAARCIGHRSTLHRPSYGAVFLETD